MDQAEQLRNVIKMNPAPRPLSRVITVTSGKGGVGKSNTSINLACQFKKMGKRVIILDADFGLANIEIMFGTVPEQNLGIAGPSNLSRDYLNYIIQNLVKLDAIADIIIIDTGAGISDAVLDFLVASGEILVVATPEPTSITDSYSLLKALNRHPRFSREDSKIMVIANKVAKVSEGEVMYNKLETVVNRYLKLPVSYLGAIPQDYRLEDAVMQQKPVSLQSPNAKSSIAYEKMAYVLMDKEYDKSLVKRGMAAFFSHIVAGNKKMG